MVSTPVDLISIWKQLRKLQGVSVKGWCDAKNETNFKHSIALKVVSL